MDPSSSKKYGKMHLLDPNHYPRSIDTLPQVLTDVYNNFVSMADVIEHAVFRDKITTSRHLTSCLWELKNLMGFIRSALKWCVSDGGAINRSLFDVLTCIEADFIEVSERILLITSLSLLTSPSSDESVLVEIHGWDKGFGINFSEQKILDAYLYIWKHCIPSTSMFTEESVMERLDHALEDDRMHKKQAIVIEKFIHFIKVYSDQSTLEEILPWVDYLLDMMMCCFFHSNMKEPSSHITSRLDAAIDSVVLHILVWHSRLPFTGELLVDYVECIKDNLIHILNKEYFYLSEQLTQKIIAVRDVLRNVLALLSNKPKYEFDEEKLSPDTALKQLGYIISSFFAFEFDGDKTSFQITGWLFRIFQAFCLQLESDGSFTTETLIQYACCFQHCLSLFSTDEGIDMKIPSENQPEFHTDLVWVTSVVLNQESDYHVEQEIPLNSKIEMVDALKGLGSIICSSLNNMVEGKTRIEMNSSLPELHLKFEHVQQLARIISIKIFIFSRLKSPQTDPLGFLNFFLENLEELRVRSFDLVREWKDQLQTIHDDLVAFRSFLKKNRDKSIICDSSQRLSIRIRNAAYSAEYIINAFIAGAFHEWTRSVLISGLIEQFNLIKEDAETAETVIQGSSDVSPHGPILTTNPEKVVIHAPSQVSTPSVDVIGGFEDVMKLLMERLASDKKQLDTISVVGMAGIGKTTLAKKVYEDPYTVNYFQLRSWCVVSHDYDKKELLLRILGTDGNPQKSFEELGERLHKKLIGRRYLIVLDDVWDIDAFICLRRFFPNVDDGSRVVLTSRAILTGHDSNPIKLNLLSDDESWNILKEKVSPGEELPITLFKIGKRIAEKCGGLPLAVVVVAGLLAKSDKDQDAWEAIAERLSIYSVANDSQGEGMKALDLSYELLPEHLKPLFLYAGAFPEDTTISTKNLKWLWIAEGFIRKSENRSQEDQAETYLMDLIDRSLLIVDERKSDGLVKNCRIHDLMRDMALSKSKAEGFLQCVSSDELLSERVIFERRVCVYNYEGSTTLVAANEAPSRRGLITYYDELSALSIPSCLNSVLLFNSRGQTESTFQNHKMLRVFHRDGYDGPEFSDDVSLPVHLRYISCCISSSTIPSSIFSLWNLETLIFDGGVNVQVPGEVWKMTKLRNLHINGKHFIFSKEAVEECCSNKLENLQTLSWPIFNIGEDTTTNLLLIGRFPNLVKLKCVFFNGPEDENKSGTWPRLESLHQLQSLNVKWWNDNENPCIEPHFIGVFPSSLKKLTLWGFELKWKDISILPQVLPNLEILKLESAVVMDELWDMEDDGVVVVFPKLKFLKLQHSNIKQWINASAENFPCLQNLVLEWCYFLKEIPSSFGEIYSLEKIQLDYCSHRASKSARRIGKEQIEEFGNDLLKVYVTHPYLPEDDDDDDDDEPSEEEYSDWESSEE